MKRRDVLKSAASVAAVAGVPAMASAPPPPRASAPSRSGSYVRTRDGQHLFIKDWGTGSPIVFVSAWALPSNMWEYQMVPLSEEFRCVAYDRRGHGRSDCPGAGYDYDTLADDLAAVLDAMDLRRVTLVGMSMAGGELVRYWTRHRTAGRVARLVFVSTASTPLRMKTPDNPDGIPLERFEAFRRTVLLRDYPRWLEENRAPFFTPTTSREMQQWLQPFMLGTSLKAVVECHRSMTSADFRAELPAIDVPTLLVHGDADVSAPIDVTGRPTAKLIRGSTLVVYEGAPHGLFLTHMERLNGDIRAFANG